MPKKNLADKKRNDMSYRMMLEEILIPFALYFAVYFFTNLVLTVLVDSILDNSDGMVLDILSEQKATVHAVVGSIAMLTGVVPLFSSFRKEQGDYRNGHTAITGVLFTVLLAITASLAINILFIRLHIMESSVSYSETANRQYSVLFPVGLFLYGIISPFAEEVVFRGIVYQRMKKFFCVPYAVVLSALLFGAYHGNMVQMAYGFCMGILIACVYEIFGGFSYAFLFHAAANAAVYLVTGIPAFYEIMIRPAVGVVFGGISVLLLVYMANCIRNSHK